MKNTDLHDEIISVLLPSGSFPVVVKKYGMSLQAVETVTPEILPLMLTYMTTGSDMARFDIAREFRAILIGIESIKTSSPDPQCTYVDAYQEFLAHYKGLPLSEQMTLGWHFNNVASELGMNSLDVGAIVYQVVENCVDGVPDGEDPDMYWRGVSALHIACRDAASLPDVQKHLSFIREAGSSTDMVELVTLAHKRSNLSVTELRTILNKQEVTCSSIREGVL